MKEFVKKNKENIIIGIVSLAAFILGCISIKPLLSFLIIGSCDAILFAPLLIQKLKKTEKNTHVSHPKPKVVKEIKEEKTSLPKKEKKKKPKKKKKVWKRVIKILIIIYNKHIYFYTNINSNRSSYNIPIRIIFSFILT